jgi:hypothetical protein
LSAKLKAQSDEYLRKELRLQEKIAKGLEANRKLEERANDDQKLVENLKNMNQRLKEEMAKISGEFAREKVEMQQAFLQQRTHKDAIYSVEGDKEKASYVPIRNRSNSSSRASLNRASSSADCRNRFNKVSTDTIMKVPAEQVLTDLAAHDEEHEQPIKDAEPVTPTQEQLAARCLKLE